MAALLVLLVIVGAGTWGVVVFNRLIRLRNLTRAAWADVDVQLVRRHDLVPQLVSAVRAYAGHERATLLAVTELRAQAMAVTSPARLGEVESALQHAVSRLFALKEQYPDLKASDNFAQLQRDLVETEDQLQYARRFYNGAVRDYNTALERVPDAIVAQLSGFVPVEFFQADATDRAATRVELASNSP
jgi:LemA protein